MTTSLTLTHDAILIAYAANAVKYRPVAVPAPAKLVIKDTTSASRLWLARRMAQMIARALPGRKIHITGDAAYAGGELTKLPPGITWTTRLRKDAAPYGLPPARTARRGRPRVKGDKLPALGKLAATAAFAPVTVTRYGKTVTVQAAVITCLWHPVFGCRRVQVVLIRDTSASGYDLDLLNVFGDFPTLSDPRHADAYSPLWDAQLGLWTPKAVAAGLNKRQIDENVVFNLAATRPDLLTGVNPATGQPEPYGSDGVDINCAVIGYTATAPTANLAPPAPGSQFPPR